MRTRQEFVKLCNEMINIYEDSVHKTLTIEDIVANGNLRKIWLDLAKISHPDVSAFDRSFFQKINYLKSELQLYLGDLSFISSFLAKDNGEEMSIEEYKKYVVERIKSEKQNYFEIWPEVKNEVEDFEFLIYFMNSKEEINKNYYSFLNSLKRKLRKKKAINSLKLYLKKFVNDKNEKNVKIFNDFFKEAEKVYDFSEIEDMVPIVETSLKKNALCFAFEKELKNKCDGFDDEEINNLINKAVEKVKLIDNPNMKQLLGIYDLYLNKLQIRVNNLKLIKNLYELMAENRNANFSNIDVDEILNCTSINNAKIIFNSLRERIVSRIDYSKRVSAKISGRLSSYSSDKSNSFTYPFIFETLTELFSYYDPADRDLSKLDIILMDKEKEIDERKKSDQEKVDRKKQTIYNNYMNDVKKGILPADGRGYFEYRLDNVDTFGGFANFENTTVRMELYRVVSGIFNYLADLIPKLKKAKMIDNKEDRVYFLNKAVSLAREFAVICEKTKDYFAIKIDDYTTIDYRAFSKMVQKLNSIDYFNDPVENIRYELVLMDEFLNGDKYDKQLERMVNDKRKR